MITAVFIVIATMELLFQFNGSHKKKEKKEVQA
jgi:hypothetical protein